MVVGNRRHVPAALTFGKRSGSHCTGSWVGPRVGLDGCGKYLAHLKRNVITVTPG